MSESEIGQNKTFEMVMKGVCFFDQNGRLEIRNL